MSVNRTGMGRQSGQPAGPSSTIAQGAGSGRVPPASDVVTITANIRYEDLAKRIEALAAVVDSSVLVVRGGAERIREAVETIARFIPPVSATISVRRGGPIEDSTPTATMRGDTPAE